MKTKILLLIQFIEISFLPFKPLIAQTNLDAKAPTLQVGLDGFSFAKGSLDAQLIMEIVAEKQKELKVKAIQNIFLDKVQNAGGTIYTFVDNVVRELVFEPDQQVRTKKIMENTVNLVFTASYLNFYLASLEKHSQSRTNLIELACFYNSKLTSKKDSLISKEVLNITDFSINLRTLKFYEDENAVEFIALLFDMTSKAIRGDAKLKQLGLMNVAYSETYEYMNLYNQLIYDKDSSQINSIAKSAKVSRIKLELCLKSVFENITNTLRGCTDFIGVANYLVEEKTFRFNVDNLINYKNQSKDSISFNTIKLIGIRDSLKNLIKILELKQPDALDQFTSIQGANLLIQKQDSTLKADIQNIVKIYFYLDKAIKQIDATKSDSADKTKLKTYADILYTLNNEFIPILKNQSFRSFKYLDIIDSLNIFNEFFFKNIISTNEVLNKYKSEIPQFLQLVSKLYQFDRGSTISEYMKLLDDIGNTFPDDNIRNALSTALKFVKDYSIIENNNNKEVLSFNVESFLYKLQSIKPYRNQRLGFLFTVGVNNIMFSKDLILPDGSISRNLSFIGEKIGVKYILFNWAFSKTRNPGETYRTSAYWPLWNTGTFIKTGPPKEPIISNWHVVAYGSGILYNLVNTKTQKEFNMPIISIGSGLTFYNGLDFNISWGVPIMPDRQISSDNCFWNVGFDIQFIEYYDKLMEKRKNNQIQKRLVEAQKH